MIKKSLKNLIGSYFSKLNYPLLVNSYGRSGSTVLTKSIVRSSIDIKNKKLENIIKKSIFQSAWNLNNSNLKSGIIYKTHDYPPKYLNKKTRIIYTFANPIDVSLSLLRMFEVKGEDWIKKHYNHLGVQYLGIHKIFKKDNLKLKKHLSSWLKEKRFNIAFVKYKSIWKHEEDISNFLGINLKLPDQKKRKSSNMDIDDNVLPRLKKIHAPLIKKINDLDSFFIINN